MHTSLTNGWKCYFLGVIIIISSIQNSIYCNSEDHLHQRSVSEDAEAALLSPENEHHDDSAHEAHSRQKRFIYFNTQSPVDIGLLITIPLSFALPTFNLKTSRRFSRSVMNENSLLANMTVDDIFPADSYDEQAYSIELNKMTTYFTILEINEDICQQRIICEIFADSEKYKPISDIFMRKLTVDRGIIEEKSANRYYRYVKAMQEGITSGEESCKKQYKNCPYSAPERLNMPALHFWTYLTTLLKMEFRDE